MRSIVIAGTGNVASHLVTGLRNAGFHNLYSLSRTKEWAETFGKEFGTTPIWEYKSIPPDCNLLILAIPDDYISDAAKHISENGYSGAIVHTSGSVPSTILDPWFKSFGVFYPLQSFTKGLHIDLKKVPFCVKANSPEFQQDLVELAHSLSDKVEILTDEDRRHLHLAAVVVNNFTNHLYSLAKQYADAHQLDFKLLIPLIEETAKKLEFGEPYNLQTGPAKRGDKRTIEKHLAQLHDFEDLKALYLEFSTQISKSFTDNPEQKDV